MKGLIRLCARPDFISGSPAPGQSVRRNPRGHLVVGPVARQVQVTTSCVLAGANRIGVRAQSEGFVRGIKIVEGQFVGVETFGNLENDDLVTRLANQETQLQIVELRGNLPAP